MTGQAKRKGLGASGVGTKAPVLVAAAPAKLNLSLSILGRREDGFHALQTRMVRLSLSDRLSLVPGKEGDALRFRCSDPNLPAGEDNLVLKAVRALERRCDRELPVSIELDKRIPSGAGLGGGSSDAATTLHLINQGFELGLSTGELAEVAAEIGSDVAFFCYESCADCSGRGEIVRPIAFPWKLPLLLVKPDFGISAAWAYKHWAESSERPSVSYVRQLCPWGVMVNDLERPVFEKYLFLARLKTWLLAQPETQGALLSGSGSTVFAVLDRNDRGRDLERRVLERFGPRIWTWVGYSLPT